MTRALHIMTSLCLVCTHGMTIYMRTVCSELSAASCSRGVLYRAAPTNSGIQISKNATTAPPARSESCISRITNAGRVAKTRTALQRVVFPVSRVRSRSLVALWARNPASTLPCSSTENPGRDWSAISGTARRTAKVVGFCKWPPTLWDTLGKQINVLQIFPTVGNATGASAKKGIMAAGDVSAGSKQTHAFHAPLASTAKAGATTTAQCAPPTREQRAVVVTRTAQ